MPIINLETDMYYWIFFNRSTIKKNHYFIIAMFEQMFGETEHLLMETNEKLYKIYLPSFVFTPQI